MKKYVLSFVALALILVTGACQKDINLESTSLLPVDMTQSFVKFINASPGSPAINFYLDNTKATGGYTALGKEVGIPYAALYPSLDYAQVKAGGRKISIKAAAASPTDPGLTTFEGNVSLAAGKYYSVFIVDQYDAVNKKQNLLVIEDKNPTVDTAKTFVRFINLQVGSGKTDVFLNAGDKVFSGVDYKNASEFVSIPNPGKENTYILKKTGTGVVIPLILKLTLSKGRSYTVCMRGIAGITTGLNAHGVILYSN